MNSVIRQIIKLDKRAVAITASANERATKIENEAREKIKLRESEIIDRTKEEAHTNYETEIAKAEAEKKSTIEDMEKQISNVRAKYEQAKTEYARQVLEELLESVD